MDLGLSGKVVFVAAASKGLGRAIAEGFARESAKVVICSRSEAAITHAAREIADKTNAEVVPVTADLSKKSDCERFLQTGLDKFGRLDVLVANAGGPPPGRLEELSESQWDAAYQLTLMSAVRLVKSALPELRKNRGNVIFSTSLSLRQPTQYVNLVLSTAMRAALHGVMKTLSKDLAKDGVRINAVLPGRILTDRVRELDSEIAKRTGRTMDDVRRDFETMSIPLGRYGDPKEYAAAVVFLASEPASYITGVSLQVDGGMLQAIF